jgi:NitT/TauT family transport system substrate-binding protein
MVASAVLAAGCGSSASRSSGDAAGPGSSGSTHLTVGVSSSTASAAVYLAEQKKYFADNGLDVDLQTIQSGADAVPRLLNGSLDIALGDAVGSIQAAANKVPLQVVGVATVSPSDPAKDYSAVVARQDVGTGTAALGRKTIAVNQINGVAELTLKAAVDAQGGDSKTLKFVELPFPQMSATVKAGRVDAALVTEPYLTESRSTGLRTVLAPQAYGVAGLPSTIFVASSSYAAKHSRAVAAFTRAVSAAAKNANADPATARSAAATYTQLGPATLKVIKMPVFAEQAGDDSGMTKMLALMNKYQMLSRQPDIKALLGTGQGTGTS